MSQIDPISLFADWFAEAKRLPALYPNAMALATVNAQQQPAVRIVLMKHFDQDGLVFYTNLESAKSRDLQSHPKASACFYWEAIKKQVRVSGRVVAVSAAEADVYFASRPRESQLGAWASDQSRPMQDRQELEQRLAEVTERFAGKTVNRPPHWSGFRIVPLDIEFWQEKPYRLHERRVYSRESAGIPWNCRLLYP